jgi:hypothetical protein
MNCQCDADVANHITHRVALSKDELAGCRNQATEKDQTSHGMQYMCKKCGDFCTKEGFSYKREPL